MADILARISTKSILAVMVVGATLLFNGIALISLRPLDAATMTLAGAVVGHYFTRQSDIASASQEPLAPPATGDEE